MTVRANVNHVAAIDAGSESGTPVALDTEAQSLAMLVSGDAPVDEDAEALAAAELAEHRLAAEAEPDLGGMPGGAVALSPRSGAQSENASEVNSAPNAASMLQAQRRAEAEVDRELIAKINSGDPRAFRTLVERHERRAFILAVSLVRDESDAREIVQEGFLRVHRGLAAFQGNSSFFTWLYRIITNLSIDHLRRPGRLVLDFDAHAERFDHSSTHDFPLLGSGGHGSPQDAVRSAEIQRCIDAALAELPEYHRTVILLREVEGMSYEEIAEAMSVSKGTVMSRLFHARQKLQRALATCYTEQIGQLVLEPDESGASNRPPAVTSQAGTGTRTNPRGRS